MKLLVWDTSSKSGTIAALEWDPTQCRSFEDVRLVAEMTLNVESTHSERLLWAIHQILESARWKLADVDTFAVGIGPGSFTGLRIGVTTARTLSVTMKKPLVGVSSLAALARPLAMNLAQHASSENSLIVAVTDACKGELFALWGEAHAVRNCVIPSQLWHASVEEQVIEPARLMKAIEDQLQNSQKKAQWYVVGEGRNRYGDEWARLNLVQSVSSTPVFSDHVQGRYLGVLAWEAVQSGLGQGGLQIHPRYLRASDAELKLKAGLLAPSPVQGS